MCDASSTFVDFGRRVITNPGLAVPARVLYSNRTTCSNNVENQEISIHSIDTDHQIADIFTKPLEEILFKKFRKQIMGW